MKLFLPQNQKIILWYFFLAHLFFLFLGYNGDIMAVDNLSLQIIADALEEQMKGAYLGSPLALSPHDFALPYSLKEGDEVKKHGTFLFSLDPTNPFACYSLERYTKIIDNSSFFNNLRRLSMGKVLSVKKYPGERILTLKIEPNHNDISEVHSAYDLVLELFPNRPNVYLIGYPEERIVAVYHEHTDIEKGIFLTKNAVYQYPDPRGTLPLDLNDPEEARPYLPNATLRRLKHYVLDEGHDLKETLAKMVNSKDLYVIRKDILSFSFDDPEAKKVEVSSLYSTFVSDQKEIARYEKIKDLLKRIEKAVKTAEKKKENLGNDLKTAHDRLVYKDYGQEIYLYQAEIQKGDVLLEKDGYKIPLSPKLTVSQNANAYFHKYQKAKSAITILGDLIQKTEDEITYLQKKKMEVEDGTPRDIQELKSELLEEGYIKEKQGRNTVYKVSKKHRYEPHYVIVPEGKIGYGMNGLQNETLTFTIAKKDDLFFHVKDYPGAHVVLLEGKENPRMKELAAELAVHLSHLDNGTVMIAKIKDVKKNPNKIGLVNILRYETIVVHDIPKEDLKLFSQKSSTN